MRPVDLAREHGLTAQAVRNYESVGFLPEADRTPSGHRVYTERHARALHAYLGLVRGFGCATAGKAMVAIHTDDLDRAFEVIDGGHLQLARDRRTLRSVRAAVGQTSASASDPVEIAASRPAFTVGELARRLGVTTTTLRNWERAGILTPRREAGTNYRLYTSAEVRDAELAHLLRRGGYLLSDIAVVLDAVRTAGGEAQAVGTLRDKEEELVSRGRAMLRASALLDAYVND